MKNISKYKNWEYVYQLYLEQTSSFQEQTSHSVNDRAFHKRMEKLLPLISQFISHELEEAIKNKTIPSGKYKTEDLVDDLYIMAYDHIHQVKKDDNLYGWVLDKAKELIEDTIVEVDFNQTFFKNIDNYTKAESAEMEEKFSVDGDGDLVMEEELDDLSYPKHDYVLNAAFIQNINNEA